MICCPFCKQQVPYLSEHYAAACAPLIAARHAVKLRRAHVAAAQVPASSGRPDHKPCANCNAGTRIRNYPYCRPCRRVLAAARYRRRQEAI